MALLPGAEALKHILEAAKTLETENVGLRDALGRTLAKPVEARVDNPPFDASAMDGYAVRSDDAAEPSATLTLIGESGAGRPFSGEVKKGETVRIFTGAPLPPGTDAVVIQEDVTAAGSHITISEAAKRGDNVRPMGQDFTKGRPLLESGRRLTARDILLAAAAAHATLPVVRRPVVALLSTGDELVDPGTELGPGQISASNSFGLAAVVEAAGGEARLLGIARDNHESLAQCLESAQGADVLVTIGGASVGDHDLVRPALEKAGAKLDFYKVAMRPGKPLFFGARTIAGKRQHCLGLPGNPVSSLICSRVFLVPLIGRLLGRDVPLESIDAVLADPLPSNGSREHFMRARLDTSTSPPKVAAFRNQDSGLITALQHANCLLVVPANAPPLPAGSPVKVLKLDI
jgi:molybdopterin molybdotransferase